MNPLLPVENGVEVMFFMRGFLVFLWAGVIFVLTCTASFQGVVDSGVIQFRWEGDPLITDLFLPLPKTLSQDFLMQKFGHLAAFFLFTVLLLKSIHSKSLTLILAISYAVLTEVLQLFFTRDGRIFDIGFDAIGILLGLSLGSLFAINSKKQLQQ
jgi:VanZ family protein